MSVKDWVVKKYLLLFVWIQPLKNVTGYLLRLLCFELPSGNYRDCGSQGGNLLQDQPVTLYNCLQANSKERGDRDMSILSKGKWSFWHLVFWKPSFIIELYYKNGETAKSIIQYLGSTGTNDNLPNWVCASQWMCNSCNFVEVMALFSENDTCLSVSTPNMKFWWLLAFQLLLLQLQL